jgi:ribosome biogenesis GTPase / thiamine phosphate phosphatase
MKLKQFGLTSSLEEKFGPVAIKGRVISIDQRVAHVMTEDGEIHTSHPKLTLGDFVALDKTHQVVNILPAQAKLTLNNQVLGSNFDTIMIVMPTDHHFDLHMLELYLNQAWNSGAFPVIILVNKGQNDVSKLLYQVRNVAAFVDTFVVDENSKDLKLKSYFKEGKTTLLLGGSNEVKTYLLNKLFNVQVDFVDQSISLFDSYILMNVNDQNQQDEEVKDAYQDIETLILGCRFKDCMHTNEPGCKVIEALEQGVLSQERYDAYLELHPELLSEELDEFEDVEDYKVYDRKKDKEKHKFTKKNSKEDKHGAFML